MKTSMQSKGKGMTEMKSLAGDVEGGGCASTMDHSLEVSKEGWLLDQYS